MIFWRITDIVKVCQIEITGFNKYHPTVGPVRYVVQPGPQFEQQSVEGMVEQRLVEALRALAKAQPIYIQNLIVNFYGGEKNHPDRWLIERVEENVVDLNLGQRVSSGLGRTRFELDSLPSEQLRTRNLAIEARLEELAQLQPDLNKSLDEGIGRGLGYSTPSS